MTTQAPVEGWVDFRHGLPQLERPHNIVAEADTFANVHSEAVLVGRRVNATMRVLNPA